MTHESVCIHAIRESLMCEGLTSAQPYAWDVIIACGIFIVVLGLIAVVTLYLYLTREVRKEKRFTRSDNDLLRGMTQAEIDKRR